MVDQKASLWEIFLKKGFWLYFFGYIIAPTWYIIKILISSEVSVSELGILYGVISLVTLLGAFSDLGLSESIKYFIPKYLEEKNYPAIKSTLIYAFVIQFITWLIIAGSLYWWSEFLALHYFKDIDAKWVLQSFAFFFLGINIFQLLTQFFLATQNTFLYKFSEFLRMIFLLISVVVMIFSNVSDIATLSFSWVFGLYVGIIFALGAFFYWYYRTDFRGVPILWSRELLGKTLSYAVIVFLSAQVSVILSQLDMQMVIYLLGTTDAGYYTTYLSFIMIPFLLIGPIFPLFLPLFSQLSKQQKIPSIVLIKSVFQKYLWLAALFFSFFFLVNSELVAITLFGKDFIPAGEILLYSCMFLIFNFFMQINFNILGGIGKVSAKLKIISFAILVNFVLNLVFINMIWVAGAALATGIGWCIVWLLSEISLGKQFFTKPDYVFFWKNIILLLVLWCVSYLVFPQIESHISGRLELFFYLFFEGIIWALVVWMVNKKELGLFLWEVKKLKKK